MFFFANLENVSLKYNTDSEIELMDQIRILFIPDISHRPPNQCEEGNVYTFNSVKQGYLMSSQ